MAFRFPYLSVDIETTGLDRQRSHVLQLAAIYDNGDKVENLQTFNEIVRWDVITYGEAFAMNLNKALLEKVFTDKSLPYLEEVQVSFARFLTKVQPHGKIFPAGKNLAGFDIPVLENPTNNFDLSRLQHRVLDPGSMYTDEYDHIPSQSELNKLVGRGAVSHDALEDCWDVVYAIRNKWGV